MPRIPTLLRTLWYLRAEQWQGQLGQLTGRALGRGSAPIRAGGPPLSLRLETPAAPFLGAPAHVRCDGPGGLELLNRSVRFDGKNPWDDAGQGPLWQYQLHQFDWIRSAGLGPDDRLEAMRDWIARHPSGVGWDGGPLSLRTISWLRLLGTPGALPPDEAARVELLASLADQLATLAGRLETRLLANHYLWNLLALVFAGVCLEGPGADTALAHRDRLREQLKEQVGADGAHYERSPMYHAALLENVLDLVNAMRALPGRVDAGFESFIETKASSMLGALEILTHPDGEIALFGDSAQGLAPSPALLRDYAKALGIAAAGPPEPGILRQAGFVRLEAGPYVLLFSVAGPSPSYQPGHAHGDALSFELSVGGHRVVTDTGVYEYAPGARRDHARSTAAHATVEIDGAEQAEFWAAHRVGGRPDVALTLTEPGRSATAVCAGHATAEVLHKRAITVEAARVEIHDAIDPPAGRAVLRLPLAPGLEPKLDGRTARIELGPGTLQIELPAGIDWSVERAAAYPEFGREVPRAVLTGSGKGVSDAVWRISLV